ncbi:NAD(P)-dependent oxidoreductase [Bryobacterales bacterium F-183]|nr:NAD(P)-dependent oxidoreductase [Bryobacterales bacterium F-183]
MILVTGATGKLGALVVNKLLQKNAKIAVGVRTPGKAAALAEQGVDVRQLDYEQPDTIATALQGVERVLLISSNDLEQRLAQHRAVIDTARAAGVKQLAYTSMLRADTSRMELAIPHRETEVYLRGSGVPYTILRNAWYLENHTEWLGAAIAHGAIIGAAGEGRFASATREDLAEAAAIVLTGEGHVNQTYELPGDSAYTLTELAAAAAKASGKTVVYRDLPQADYEAALAGMGLPPALARALADADEWAAKGELDRQEGGSLRALIGRESTPMDQAVAAMVTGAS